MLNYTTRITPFSLPRFFSSLQARLFSKGYVGPPDPVSNLRTYKYELPDNATALEIRLHEEREAVQKWNHAFWSSHNTHFIKLKDEFVKKELKEKGVETLNADEMSVFYKKFLDDNWQKHFLYNFTWYRKNVNLAFLHLKVKLENSFRLSARPRNFPH